MFNEVDGIVLVHSAKSAMDFSVGKALEALVSAGQTKKTVIAFTHMDVVHGPNLRGRAKYEHAFNNLRNIVENQLGEITAVRGDQIRYRPPRAQCFLPRQNQRDGTAPRLSRTTPSYQPLGGRRTDAATSDCVPTVQHGQPSPFHPGSSRSFPLALARKTRTGHPTQRDTVCMAEYQGDDPALC
jgi:hypothetical protein